MYAYVTCHVYHVPSSLLLHIACNVGNVVHSFSKDTIDEKPFAVACITVGEVHASFCQSSVPKVFDLY